MKDAVFSCTLENKIGNPIVDKILSPYAASVSYFGHSGGRCMVNVGSLPDEVWKQMLADHSDDIELVRPPQVWDAPPKKTVAPPPPPPGDDLDDDEYLDDDDDRYFCGKCGSNHMRDSKKGISHIGYAE